MSAVQLDVALDPAASQINGEMTVDWRNAAAVPLDEVWFRLFPNANYYGEGNLAVIGRDRGWCGGNPGAGPGGDGVASAVTRARRAG